MTDAPPGPLQRVAAWGLPGAPELIPPMSEADEDGLVSGAIGARLSCVLLAAADVGAVNLSDESVEHLAEQHRRALWWCLKLEQRLLEVLEAFAQGGGVRALSVKGPAIAHLDTPDPAERTFADIDLLIHGADLDRAVAIIAGMGATRPWAERRPGYDHRFAKSVTLTMPDGIEIDVHRSLCDGAHGFRIDLDSIFLSATSFELGGVDVRCPDRTHRLLHAAYHLLLGSREPSLMNLRDLARALTDPTIDQDAVIGEVRAWRGDAVLAGAIDAVRETLGIVVPNWDEWRAGVSISERELAVIDRQRVEGSGLGRGKLDALLDLPRLADRGAYGYALVWPSRAHLESRGMTRRELWR